MSSSRNSRARLPSRRAPAPRDQLEAESDRIRQQAEQREERARRAAEEEIKASANKARREALAAADQTAPSWGETQEQQSTSPISGYRTF